MLDVRSIAGGGREFLVCWKAYDGADTWEPEANLLPSLVREFLDSQEEAAPASAPTAAPAAAPAPARGGKAKGKAAAAAKRPAAPLAPAQAKRAAPASAQPAVPALEVGAAMEVKGCGEDCNLSCLECPWETCEIVADHGELCDVRIKSDGELCKGVRRCHVRPLARAAQKRAAVAAAQEPPAAKKARPAPAPRLPAASQPAKRKGGGR